MYNLDDLELAVSNAYKTVGHVIVVLYKVNDERIMSDGLVEQDAIRALREAENALEDLTEYFGFDEKL